MRYRGLIFSDFQSSKNRHTATGGMEVGYYTVIPAPRAPLAPTDPMGPTGPMGPKKQKNKNLGPGIYKNVISRMLYAILC